MWERMLNRVTEVTRSTRMVHRAGCDQFHRGTWSVFPTFLAIMMWLMLRRDRHTSVAIRRQAGLYGLRHRLRTRHLYQLRPGGRPASAGHGAGLGDDDPADIPAPVQGFTFYRLAHFDLSDAAYEALYRHLTGQCATPKPELGVWKVLPPRPRGVTPPYP